MGTYPQVNKWKAININLHHVSLQTKDFSTFTYLKATKISKIIIFIHNSHPDCGFITHITAIYNGKMQWNTLISM